MSGYPSSPAEREDPRLHPRMAADEKAKEALAELVSGGDRPAWAGTPPAEGTRRALIRDAIERTFAGKVFPTDFDGYNELYLDLADAIELALLDSGDDKREADAQEAIAAVGESLDRIDAPQGATYADRIDRLDRDFALRCDSLLAQREQARAGEDTFKVQRDFRQDRLLRQREQARAGEDTFKAQRDSALHLLRWLIGDLIPADLIRFEAEEETDA